MEKINTVIHRLIELEIEPIEGVYGPMSKQEIGSLEKYLGCNLPKDYKSFLEMFGVSLLNGPTFLRPISPVPLETSLTGIISFGILYGKREGDNYDVEEETKRYVDRIPAELFPIGGDLWGNLVCMGRSGEHYGKVYFWDWAFQPSDEEDYLEDYGVPRPPEAIWENVHLIAETFTDFVFAIEWLPEEEVSDE